MINAEKNDPFDFVSRLNSELLLRMEKNEQYSLRAFARDLGVDPSNLSKLLRRKNKASLSQIKYLAKSLKITDDEVSDYIEFRSTGGSYFSPHRKPEDFQLNHWKYMAIMEVICNSKEQVSSKDSIIAKLSLDEEEVQYCLEFLVEGKYISSLGEDKYKSDSGENGFLAGRFSSDHTKKNLYKSYLEASQYALDNRLNSENVFTTMTLSFDKDKYLEAKEYLKKISLEFDEKFCSKKENSEIYNLNLNFYPLARVDEVNDV